MLFQANLLIAFLAILTLNTIMSHLQRRIYL